MGRDDLTHCHVAVRGRVQGVGFRWFVREQATAMGLRGSVRNLPDGSVEVRAMGGADSIARLIEILAAGPRGASVTAVDHLDPIADDAILPTPFAIER